MIEMLEYIVVLFSIGNYTFLKHLFNQTDTLSIVQCFVGALNLILPMDKINSYIFE